MVPFHSIIIVPLVSLLYIHTYISSTVKPKSSAYVLITTTKIISTTDTIFDHHLDEENIFQSLNFELAAWMSEIKNALHVRPKTHWPFVNVIQEFRTEK